MKQEFVLEYAASVERLRERGEAFALATVIKVHGSTSARLGAKAIFNAEGENIFGWVGGGCAERFVGEQARQSLLEKTGRVVLADLDDEIFGLGVACGGKMEIFIDPITPLEVVPLPRSKDIATQAEELALGYGLRIHWQNRGGPLRDLAHFFCLLAQALAQSRGRSGLSLRQSNELPVRLGLVDRAALRPAVSILGRGRIVESVANHFACLAWPVRCVEPADQSHVAYHPGECVIIASHSSRDPQLVREALRQGASYVGMIGSRKRAFEVLEHLALPKEIFAKTPLFVPAGIDIGAKNPQEIGLSIAAELLGELGAVT